VADHVRCKWICDHHFGDGVGRMSFFTVDTEFSWVDFGVWTLQSCYCEQENKLRRDELRPQIGTFEAYIRRVLYTCEPNKDI